MNEDKLTKAQVEDMVKQLKLNCKPLGADEEMVSNIFIKSLD